MGKTCMICIMGLGLLVSACGNGENKQGQELAQKLSDGLGDEFCEYVFRCCDATEVKAVATKRFTDKASCKAYRKLDSLLDTYAMLQSVADGELDLDADAVDACITAWQKLTCDTPYTKLKAPEACDSDAVFIGLRGGGQACTSSFACEKGLHCVKPMTSYEGICIPYRKLGEVCGSSTTGKDACDPDLACANPQEGVRTCKPLAKAGESCEEVPCDKDNPDLYCDRTTDPLKPVCAARKGEGDACKSSSYCKTGLFCDSYTDPMNPVCKSPGQTGQPCKTSTQCQTGLFCDTYTDPMNPVCKSPLQKGQPCKYTSQCQKTLYCDRDTDPMNPVCATKKELGETCQSSTECASNKCDYQSHTCVPGTPSVSTAVCDGK